MKKDIYVCEVCSKDFVCAQEIYRQGFLGNDLVCTQPVLGATPNWQKTTDYEIVRKDKEKSLPTEPSPTPNCSICEWIMYEIRPDETVPDNFSYEHGVCKSQGNQDSDECYNSNECKRLFSAKDLPTCEPPTEGK